MIDYHEARILVKQHLAEENAKSREIAESGKSLTPRECEVLGLGPSEEDAAEVVLLDDATLHFEGGWAFFCQYKKYLESSDFHDMLVGDGPIIVSSSDGSLHVTGSAHPPEFYIENFQRYGSPNG